jgi:hypothetical protein
MLITAQLELNDVLIDIKVIKFRETSHSTSHSSLALSTELSHIWSRAND